MGRKVFRALASIALLSLLPSVGRADPSEEPSREDAPGRLRTSDGRFALRLGAEIGAVGVLAHHIRYGAAGTRVDYRRDADQDTLFRFWRVTSELWIARRHAVIFVVQPLSFETEAVLTRDLQVGTRRFEEGNATRFGYGFDFYRAVYQYDLFRDERRELALGGGAQIRNARISFITSDGAEGFTQTNLGVVPLLRARGRLGFERGRFMAVELDGLITPTPTGRGPGGARAFGAVLDASLRAGLAFTFGFETYLNLRYLGGGYRGESSGVPGLDEEDAWTSNWLHTLTLSLGVTVR